MLCLAKDGMRWTVHPFGRRRRVTLKGIPGHKAAAEEALQEAGVKGRVDREPVVGYTRANRIAIPHGAGNTAVLLLFAASWSMRSLHELAAPSLAMLLSIIRRQSSCGHRLAGGELVARLSVGVDEYAHVNAPSSMADRAIIEQRTSYRDAA